ncbi:MAG: polymer-forming cytoskeletal protein [Bdellovibrionales bacterium]|nr:polymer-forming cytoskeletal protein [Bdellovibrionales bacterium]
MAFSKGSSDNDKHTSTSHLGDVGGRSGQAAFLGSGSKVVGKLTFTGPAVLGGQVEGEIKAEGRLEVGESAVVHAKIEGADIIVKGTIEGDVVATSKLELFRSGKIVGNVSCASLHIEDGAVFEGSCKMINRTPSNRVTTIQSKTSEAGGAIR